MNSRANCYPADEEEPLYVEDALQAAYALLDAMSRFYRYDRILLRRPCSRLLLMNRIGGCLNIELAQRRMEDLYASDLVMIGEEWNLAVRGRRQPKDLMSVEVVAGPPSKPEDPAPYKLGIRLQLIRTGYLLEWGTADWRLKREMNSRFADRQDRYGFFGADAPPAYRLRLRRIGW